MNISKGCHYGATWQYKQLSGSERAALSASLQRTHKQGVVDAVQKNDAIQRNEVEKRISRNLKKFTTEKCRVQYIRRNNPCGKTSQDHLDRPGASWWTVRSSLQCLHTCSTG